MNTKVHVLTDFESLGWLIQELLIGLGYESEVSSKISQFRDRVSPGAKYLLIVDYLLTEGDCRDLLLDLLKNNLAPVGLLVMSGLPNFEKFLDEIAERYAERDISFFFLEKPFDKAELGELLLRLTKGLEGALLGCLKLPKYNYQEVGRFGPILRAARENLGLDRNTVSLVARKRGHFSITEKRLEEIESDETGRYIDAGEWDLLTRLLYESPDCGGMGFEQWFHLRRVRNALQEKSYPFPMNFVLRRRLVELARREKVEERYSDLVMFGAPPRRIK